MIHIENLSKSFGAKQVLRHINLRFEPGRVYGIVGENGAGKTTLFRCMAGLESYDEGWIHTVIEPLKNVLGYLPTEPVFLSRMTGSEYLKLLCVARGIREDHFEEQNIFELPLGEYAENYSTGMKKKLALLGILLQHNQVLILDEPFNGVDIHSNILITEIIHRLRAAQKTVLISSHIFSTLSDNCDEIHLLHAGTIAKSVQKDQFTSLDREMKDFAVGTRLDKLSFDLTQDQ